MTPPGGARRGLHAIVSERAYRALRSWTDEQGITITAFIEGMGRALDDGERPGSTGFIRMVLDEARSVDAERRRRRDPEPE